MFNALEKQGVRQTRRCKNQPLTTAQAYSLMKERDRLTTMKRIK